MNIRWRKKNRFLDLRPREIVQVRSEEEIAATLDGKGSFEGMPFIPEMRKFCGKRFKVIKQVKKLIIEGSDLGMRHLKNTVILDGVTCNGEAHGCCQRTCFLLWKDSWLNILDKNANATQISEEVLAANDCAILTVSKEGIYKCQSTCLIDSTSSLAPLDIRQYIWDITSETYKPHERLIFLLKSFLRRVFRIFKRKRSGSAHGQLTKTPVATLNLRPGDIVEVKSKDSVLETLDPFGKNRGLIFTVEMFQYCQKKYRVIKKLDKMINETTGELRRFSNTVLLEGVTCDGKAHGGCQRNCYSFWREIWLRKIS